MKLSYLGGACLAALVSAHPASCLAQAAPSQSPTTSAAQPPAAPASSDDASNGLHEIIVTANRRTESAQRVPIAVAAFSAATLKAVGASSTNDLPLMIPGLQLQPSGPSQPIFLRGVGSAGLGNSGAAVLTFVDGVYEPFNNGAFVFNNVASIEVDKGPQGTLFGRNATGGVIQIHTKDPTFAPKADVSVGYGNYDTATGSLYVSSGIGKSVATDLAVYYNQQFDGWGKNIATGKDVFTNRDFAIRSNTLIELSDRTKIHLTADYRSDGSAVGDVLLPAVPQRNGQLFNEVTGVPFTIPGSRYNVDSNFAPFSASQTAGVSLRIDHDFGAVRGLSISSYHHTNYTVDVDYDGTPIPFINITRHDVGSAVSQEFQLQAPEASAIKWVTGVFYLHTTDYTDPFQFAGIGPSIIFNVPGAPPAPAPDGSRDIFAHSYLTSYAVFGQATVTVLPQTNLTVGARYTIDRASYDGYVANSGVPIPGTQGASEATFKKPTFRAILEHSFTHDILAYASYNRGYNTGGFNVTPPFGFATGTNAIQPETIDAYEAGIKSELFDHKLRFNASGFWYNYSNLQQQIFESGAVTTVNAAKARIKGIDVDLQARPIHGLTLAVGGEYLHSKFLSYPDAPIYTYAPNGALTTASGSAAGNYTTSAPKFSWNASANYTIDTSIGKFESSVIGTYTASWFADAGNNLKEPAHYLVNLSETWSSTDGKTQVTGWVKNLTNHFYDAGINVLAPVGATGQLAPPRTYGVTLTRHFG